MKDGNFFLEEARKTLAKKNVLGSIFGFGASEKYEEAAELFIKAANAFKLSNEWQSAGDALKEASDAFLLSGSSDSGVTNSLVEAGNCFKKASNPVEALSMFQRAIEKYNENGKFGQSARYYKEMAETVEADNNKEAALEYYQLSADFFIRDNKKSNANQNLLKVALFASEMGDLKRASDIYESIGLESLQSRLGAYSAKGYFLQCLLCHLAVGDFVAVEMKLNFFKQSDHTFESSRENTFVEQILQVRTLNCYAQLFEQNNFKILYTCYYLGV